VEEGSLHRKVAVVLMGNQVVVVLQGSLVVVVDMENRNLVVDKGLEVLSGSCSFCEI
jgi:hypothetical protein